MNRHSNMSRRGLYRSRNGLIAGVCRGIADYFNFSVSWVRAIAVILFILTGLWPVVGIYILAALLMKLEPASYVGSRPKQAYERRYDTSSHDIADRMKQKWQHLEKRIGKMEDKVTSREFHWNNRFHG